MDPRSPLAPPLAPPLLAPTGRRRSSARRSRGALLLGALVALFAIGCGDDDDAAPGGSRGDPTPTSATDDPSDPDPHETEASPNGRLAPGETGGPASFVAPTAPPGGCAFSEASAAWQRPGWVDIAATDRGFLIGGTADHGAYEMAFLATVGSGGGASVMTQTRLEAPVPDTHRRAPPALEVAGEHAALSLVDGQGRLLIARFDPLDSGALRFYEVAPGASLRFSPALARVRGAWWVAWTEERGEHGRRLFALRVPDEGDVGDPIDLTPSAGGGAAPAFIQGAEPPSLVFLDAREGTSVAHRATVEGNAFSEVSVARPVGMVTDPPMIAAFRVAQSDFLVYTGIGTAATTAVGLMPLAGTDSPTPIVPGTGYGVVYLDAAPLPEGGAIVVADAPIGNTPTSPREMHVRRFGATGGLSEPAVLHGPSESTTHARVAVRRDVIAVTFRSDVGVHAAVGRCAE
ncbi:MAG: hypothetical protein AB7S26_05055 [Sandaracinaceae bacterium]